MKTRRIVLVAVAFVSVWTMAARRPLATVTRPAAGAGPKARLDDEGRNDERMWQVVRLMLASCGFKGKVPQFDALWDRSTKADQWAQIRWPDPRESLLPDQVVRQLSWRNARGGFSGVFQEACREEKSLPELFKVLALWTAQGGQPVIQGRYHLALHFIYGAACEASFGEGVGAAILKEQIDQEEGGSFNLDELAAGLAGAEWVRHARADSQWVELWARGRKTIDRNLPRFSYGDGEYSDQVIRAIDQDILLAYGR